jgi:hypothetical protein
MSETTDPLTQAAELLETPDALRQWLSKQDPQRRINPTEPCKCYIYQFLRDRTGLDVAVFYTGIIAQDQTLDIEHRWFFDFQMQANLACFSDKNNKLSCREAIEVLDAVIAEQATTPPDP